MSGGLTLAFGLLMPMASLTLAPKVFKGSPKVWETILTQPREQPASQGLCTLFVRRRSGVVDMRSSETPRCWAIPCGSRRAEKPMS